MVEVNLSVNLEYIPICERMAAAQQTPIRTLAQAALYNAAPVSRNVNNRPGVIYHVGEETVPRLQQAGLNTVQLLLDFWNNVVGELQDNASDEDCKSHLKERLIQATTVNHQPAYSSFATLLLELSCLIANGISICFTYPALVSPWRRSGVGRGGLFR
jgi:hypothetical protein